MQHPGKAGTLVGLLMELQTKKACIPEQLYILMIPYQRKNTTHNVITYEAVIRMR